MVVTDRLIGPCWQLRRNVVRCRFWERGDDTDDVVFICSGTVGVRETWTRYYTRGIGVICD